MHRKGKRLLLSSHHFPSKQSQVLWADVWIKVTTGPGRKKLYLGPTIVGLDDMEFDAKIDAKLKHKPDAEHAEAKKAFSLGATHFIGKGPKDMATLYAPERLITPAIAERLCLAYAQSLGVEAARVKWTRSKVFTTPS